jgi:uncharacterized protein YkwD
VPKRVNVRFRASLITVAVLAAAVAVANPANAAASVCPGAAGHPTRESLGAATRATLCLLNIERRRHGLRPLRENGRLDRAARRHSRSMVRKRNFDHGDFAGRIRNAGYRATTLGENIAWGSGPYATPWSIVRMWMHSPRHRANIMRAAFSEIGIGVALGAPEASIDGAATYTTDFGER